MLRLKRYPVFTRQSLLSVISALIALSATIVAAAPSLDVAPVARSHDVSVAPIAALNAAASSSAGTTALDTTQRAADVRLQGWLVARSAIDGSAVHQRLIVGTLDGTFAVDVHGSTRLRAGAGGPLTPEDLRAGMRLSIEGHVRTNAVIEATEIVAADPPAAQGETLVTVRGRVLVALEGAARNGDDLVVLASATGVVVAEVGADVNIRDADGQALNFAELRAGNDVAVSGRGQPRLVISVSDVTVQRRGRPSLLRVSGTLHARAELSDGEERWIVGTAAVTVTADVAAGVAVSVGDRVELRVQRDVAGELLCLEGTALAPVAERVELRGKVDAVLEAGVVIVEGLRVVVDAETVTTGTIEPDAFVAVRTRTTADGQLVAEYIEVVTSTDTEVQFEGQIQAVELLQIDVDGTTVRIDPSVTIVTGLSAAIGLHAEIQGVLLGDGTVNASRVHVALDALGGLLLREGRLVEVGPVPGSWRLVAVEAGAEVEYELLVSEDTIIDESRGAATVGSEAQVRASLVADATLAAEVIRIRRGNP